MNGKPRHPLSIFDSLMIAIGTLSEDVLKRATGHSKKYLYQCSDPDDKGKNIWLESAANLEAEMLHIGKHAGFTEAFEERVSRRLEELTGEPRHDPKHPTERTCDALETVAELLGNVRRGAHPDSPGGEKFTPNEAAEITPLCIQAIEHLTAIMKDVNAHGTEATVTLLETA